MAINLLEELCKKDGIEFLKKVDPNTQQIKTSDDAETVNKLDQAVYPAVVAGIYDAARSEEGLDFLTSPGTSKNLIDLLFGKHADEVKQQIASYAGEPMETVNEKFNTVATSAIDILRDNATGDDQRVAIRNLAGSQRDLFLPYLPGALQIGKFLEDDTMDDRTNKMEGPVSSIMHKIETLLTGQESKEDATKKRDANM